MSPEQSQERTFVNLGAPGWGLSIVEPEMQRPLSSPIQMAALRSVQSVFPSGGNCGRFLMITGVVG